VFLFGGIQSNEKTYLLKLEKIINKRTLLSLMKISNCYPMLQLKLRPLARNIKADLAKNNFQWVSAA